MQGQHHSYRDVSLLQATLAFGGVRHPVGGCRRCLGRRCPGRGARRCAGRFEVLRDVDEHTLLQHEVRLAHCRIGITQLVYRHAVVFCYSEDGLLFLRLVDRQNLLGTAFSRRKETYDTKYWQHIRQAAPAGNPGRQAQPVFNFQQKGCHCLFWISPGK